MDCQVDKEHVIFSLNIVMAIFPGGPGLANTRMSPISILDFIGAKNDGGRGVQSSSQIIATNKTTTNFKTGQMPFLSPNQQGQSTEGKK